MELTFTPTDIVVFVGPNNTGKSVALTVAQPIRVRSAAPLLAAFERW